MKLSFLVTILLISSISIVNAQNDFYPLELGVKLTYRYAEAFSTVEDQMLNVATLDNFKKINGKEYFVIQTSMGNKEKLEKIQTAYVRKLDDGAIVGFFC